MTTLDSTLFTWFLSSLLISGVNLSEISDQITVESMKEAMIKATNAVRLGKVPTESKVEEYKKIFENDEWILEGKGL